MLRAKYEQLEISYDGVWSQIKDLIIKALITIQSHICNKLSKTGTQRDQCFDLFGFDVLVDDTLKPWLLEVNMSPSLSCSAKLDKQIKTSLLSDAFHLIGLQPFVHSEASKVQLPPLGHKQDKDIGHLFNPYLDSIQADTVITEKDVNLLISLDEELRRY